MELPASCFQFSVFIFQFSIPDERSWKPVHILHALHQNAAHSQLQRQGKVNVVAVPHGKAVLRRAVELFQSQQEGGGMGLGGLAAVQADDKGKEVLHTQGGKGLFSH